MAHLEHAMDSEMWSLLSEDLVEKILARLPLPKLYQALSVSKVWSRKLDDACFRAELMRVSHEWPAYCPLLLSEEGLIGFNSDSRNWQKLFSLRYIPQYANYIQTSVIELCSSVGSLLCFAVRNTDSDVKENEDCQPLEMGRDGPLSKRSDYWSRFNMRFLELLGQEFDLTVTNVITKQWKRLPRRPHMQRPHIMQLLQGSDSNSSSGYRVILFTPLDHFGDPHQNSACLQIYNSITESWAVKYTFTSHFHCYRSPMAYFEKKFYMMAAPKLTAFDIDDTTWCDVPLPNDREARVSTGSMQSYTKIISLKFGLILITWDDMSTSTSVQRGGKAQFEFVIHRLDEELGRFVEVAKGPPNIAYEGRIDVIVGHDDVIYFGSKYFPSSRMLVYNLQTRLWSHILPPMFLQSFNESTQNVHWTTLAFQPGLNTFTRV